MSQKTFSRANDNQFRLKLYTGLVLSVILVLSALSLFAYTTVDKRWQDFSRQNLQVYSLHDRLVQLVGYGGLIHDFKNLVIRKNLAEKEILLATSFRAIYQTIDELEQFESYDKESLLVIRQTIDSYQQNFQLVKALISQGLSTEEIDQQVRVDDTAALAELAKFDNNVKIQLQQQSARLDEDFRYIYYFQISSVVIIIALLMFYFKSLLSANKKQRILTEQALAGITAKTEFLANISHEVRTPLNSIMGVLQLLQRKLERSSHRQFVDNALQSANYLLEILNNILDFSKLEAKKVELEKIDFSIKRVIESVIWDMKPIADSKNIALSLEFDDEVSIHRRGDPNKLKQIILNLVSNAIKFTDTGFVKVSVMQSKEKDAELVHIYVQDTGIGLTQSEMEKIFDRFSQADPSITRTYGGTGLGLPITKELVGLLGGEIKFASTVNKGTKVVLSIPLEFAESNVHNISKDELTGPPLLAGKRLLVVEDNEINQMVVQSMLEVTQATILFADNGEQALDKFNDDPPDVILMDIQMPVMDGVQACKKIRESDNNIPIFALTANVMQQDIDNYLSVGFNGHIAKPIDLNHLYSMLNQVKLN